MHDLGNLWKRAGLSVVACSLAWGVGCGGDTLPADTNLLDNPSFEEVDNGLPRGWEINNFRGLAGMEPSTYGIDSVGAYAGRNAFRFDAAHDAQRFFMLSQEVRVGGADRLRLRAAVKYDSLRTGEGQYPQSSVALTYYDKNRARFQSRRFADARTTPNAGTSDGWEVVETLFNLPPGTEYVTVHCVLGMSGHLAFDDLSLTIPTGLPWQIEEREVFVHAWLEGSGYPDGAMDAQQQLYEYYAGLLGVPESDWRKIFYYLYPDTATLRETLDIDGDVDVDYDAREIHTIHPVENHEIIHLMLEPYGRLPVAFGEGTAYYLIGDIDGKPIQPEAQRLLLAGRIPPLVEMVNPVVAMRLDGEMAVCACASFVGYLLEYGGPDRFIELHRQMTLLGSDPGSFPEAFANAYNGSLEDAERVWRLKLATADFSRTVSGADSAAAGEDRAR